MFERYTETARKAIFYGRYQASQFGSKEIEVEHLLLGLLRADLPLAIRVFKTQEKLDEVRQRISSETPRTIEKVATSVDLPLSSPSKRALSYAVEEATRLNQPHIAPEHLLLGIARESSSIAARIVLECGITFSQLEQEARQANGQTMAAAASASPAVRVSTSADASATVTSQPTGLPDLVSEAREGAAPPLIGRAIELEKLLQILSRRTKNCPVLIGEPGVGKESLVYGLAQRIADEAVPADLADLPILRLHAAELIRALRSTRSGPPAVLRAIYEGPGLLYVRGLFENREPMPELTAQLRSGRLRVIATSSPLSFRLALEQDEELSHCFQPVSVLPPTEEETAQILNASKNKFEDFHGVVFSPAAIQTAIVASGRFLRHRALPDRALDLIDEAGALLRVRREIPPEQFVLKRRFRQLDLQIEQAFINHDFDASKKISEEQREIREKLDLLRHQTQAADPRGNTVTPDDILEVIAARTSLTLAAVKAALEKPQPLAPQDQLRNQITAGIPVGRRDWIEGLLSYLSDCSSEDADHFLEALRSLRQKLD